MSLVCWESQVICQRMGEENVTWPNTPGLPSPSLPGSWLSEQGCVTDSPRLIWCFTFPLLMVTVSSLHLLSAILLCIQVFVEENPVLDVSAYFPLIPICPIKCETNLLFARQAGSVSFSIVSSDQYLGFSNVLQRGSESMYHSGSSIPMVSVSQAGFTAGHLWPEFWWISHGAWRIDHFIHTEGSQQFEADQVTTDPTGAVVNVSGQSTGGR